MGALEGMGAPVTLTLRCPQATSGAHGRGDAGGGGAPRPARPPGGQQPHGAPVPQVHPGVHQPPPGGELGRAGLGAVRPAPWPISGVSGAPRPALSSLAGQGRDPSPESPEAPRLPRGADPMSSGDSLGAGAAPVTNHSQGSGGLYHPVPRAHVLLCPSDPGPMAPVSLCPEACVTVCPPFIAPDTDLLVGSLLHPRSPCTRPP